MTQRSPQRLWARFQSPLAFPRADAGPVDPGRLKEILEGITDHRSLLAALQATTASELARQPSRPDVALDALYDECEGVSGQEIMTADKVTLRMNAVVTFKVADALRAVTTVEDHRQALYREAQLALRAIVGARTLEALLGEKPGLPAAEASGVTTVPARRASPGGAAASLVHPLRPLPRAAATGCGTGAAGVPPLRPA